MVMALAAWQWRWQGGERDDGGGEGGGRGGGGREEGGAAAARWLIYSAGVAVEGNHPLVKLQNTLTKTYYFRF
jgi:hypothetical protein